MRRKLEFEGITENSTLSAAQISEFGMKQSFLKVENNVLRSMGELKEKAGRLIQGSSSAYLCLMGPYFQRLQELIKRDLNKNNFMCFTSGVSTMDCANHIMKIDGDLLENDVSSWDASLNIMFADLEIWLCELLKAPPAVIQLLKNNRIKHGRTFFGFAYTVPGTRASGEPFTSLFNSLWNCCIHLYIYCVNTNSTVVECRAVLRGLFQGDDCALKLPKRLNIDWQLWFLFFGFESKAVIRANPFDLEFCSMRLYPVKEGWCFGPKIGKVISKLGYFISPPQTINPKVMLRGVCLGLLPNCSFLFPLRSLVFRLMDLTSDVNALPTHREDWQMTYSACTGTAETDSAIEHHYNITPGILSTFEREIDKPLGDDSRKMVFGYICDKDTSGPKFYLH
jgi:hypothetical protein